MFRKGYTVISMVNGFPSYLHEGGAPLFDNFKISGIIWHFSNSVNSCYLFKNETEVEIMISCIINEHRRFAPLTYTWLYV